MLRLRVALVPVALLAVVACTLPSPLPPLTSRPNTSEDAKTAKVAADGVNAFAADLYGQLRTENGNLIVSPYSVSAALSLTAAGAQGNTRTEMESVLHLPPGAKVGPAYGAMTNGTRASVWSGRGKESVMTSELLVANSLWLQKGDSWKKEYLALAQHDFRATLSGADFAHEPEAARGRINKWVENQTRDHIKDLVPPDGISGNTRLVVANAIYFKARWAEAFKKTNTRPEDFTLATGQKIQTPLMHQKGEFWLQELDGLQVLRLPYNGPASMYVLLPRTADGLPALEQQLTAENIAKWTRGPLKSPLVEAKVWLPKFKFSVPTELATTLQKMGMKEAFDASKANFTGMTEHPEGLYIGRVIHKAFVELDEEGTEAAAATAVVMFGRSAAGPEPALVNEFRADHPFVFVIKHEPTGTVLFMGRVLDPTR